MNRADLQTDALAGATVALVGLPQCLAYAVMSGLPPAYGLTTAVVPGLVAALAGRSRNVITGPTNTTGLLVLGALVPFLGANGLLQPSGLGWLATLTLLCGVLRFVFAFAGGVVLVRFIPESVLAGFTVGVGILIGTMQLDEALGLPAVSAAGLWAEYQGLAVLLAAGTRPSPLAVGVTLACVAALALGQLRWRRVPGALLVVVGAALTARLLQLDGAAGLPLVSDRTVLPGGWPPGALPDLRPSVVGTLLPPSAAIVLLGTLELLVSVRADQSRPAMRREIVAQGCANVAGAFTAAFPASASLSRSALLRFGDPQTRAAAALAALLTLPILLFGARLIAYVPQAALAGVLFITAASMVRQPALGRMWRASAASRLLLVVTTVSTLVLPLTWAVFVGAGLGLLIHLARTSAPRVRPLTFRDERLVPVEPQDNPAVVVLEVSGSVHYAAVDPLLEEVERHLPPAARLVIIDLSHAHELRFTGLRALEWWAADLKRRGIRLRLAGVTPEVREVLEGAGSHLPYTMWDPEPGRSAWNSYRDSGT
ncbi:MAG: SulP family inorganic anion transporter [Acidobacteria bacterium]|nr:SulP family inorganic anion transporter [Acidobacteriota bacterium]